MNRPYLLIPAYQPGAALLTLVQELLTENMPDILVIDDGSGPQYREVFSKLPEGVKVLTHEVNRGKGAAIKTGLAYLRDREVSVITVDADGQHLAMDVKKIYDAALRHSKAFILGVREFNKSVPFRSRFGNQLSAWLFERLYRYQIFDTQTGLRAIPAGLQNDFLKLTENRYEFEAACLIRAVKQHQVIEQIPIQTVYLNHNASSHFNPLVDSFKIYYVFFKG